jgi:hypothetical protein
MIDCQQKWIHDWLPKAIDECLFGEDGGDNGDDGNNGDNTGDKTCLEKIMAQKYEKLAYCETKPEEQ